MNYPRLLVDQDGTCIYFVRDESNAFMFIFNPMRQAKKHETNWPIDSITHFSNKKAAIAKFIKDMLHPKSNKELGITDEEEFEPMVEKSDINVDHIEGLIAKYGQNYDHRTDYIKLCSRLHSNESVLDKALNRDHRDIDFLFK